MDNVRDVRKGNPTRFANAHRPRKLRHANFNSLYIYIYINSDGLSGYYHRS